METLTGHLPQNRISVDWVKPWFAPWRSTGEAVADAINAGMPVWEAFNVHGRAPVRFVPQAQLPPGKAYEQAIHESGNCPTREGLHDYFNALCWLRFPQTKKRLNQLQAQQIAERGVGAVRGATRDALTLFDENALLVQAPDALWDGLVAKDWPRIFADLRLLWAKTRVHPFGHALLEKLVTPRKTITAHVYRVPANLPDADALDFWLARHLSAAEFATKPFAHLPVLGIPGWCSANTDPAFYADPEVFRPARAPAVAVQ